MKSYNNINNNSNYTGIVSFIMLIGTFSFYIAGYWEGGFSGLQALIISILLSFIVISLVINMATYVDENDIVKKGDTNSFKTENNSEIIKILDAVNSMNTVVKENNTKDSKEANNEKYIVYNNEFYFNENSNINTKLIELLDLMKQTEEKNFQIDYRLKSFETALTLLTKEITLLKPNKSTDNA